MPELLEILMLLCFGCSWPLNLMKAYRAGTAKGQSLPFLVLIFTGYLCGIASKLWGGHFKWYVLFVYVLNAAILSLNILVYFRNRALDRKAKDACAC